VRVFGILLVFLAGPALATEAGDSPDLARFAYAKSQAFLITIAPRLTSTGWPVSRPHFMRIPAPPQLHVLTVAAAEHLAGYADSLPPVQVASRVDATLLDVALPEPRPTPPQTANAIGTVGAPPLIAAVAPTHARGGVTATRRLAALNAVPVSETAPIAIAPTEPRPAPLQTVTSIAVTDPAIAPAVAPMEKRPASERFASLSDRTMPEPMRLLPKVERKPPAHRSTKRRKARTKAKPKVKARPKAGTKARAYAKAKIKRARPEYAQRRPPAMTHGTHRPTRPAADTTAERAIPRWAAKMYEPSWQQHAFTYQ
jgi:hypothetical protein